MLWPFYEKFRARMDAAGWQDKPAFVEPNLFWNANLDFQKQEGGLLDAGTLGPRYVFNTHFYDQKAISGIFMPGKAERRPVRQRLRHGARPCRRGRYAGDHQRVRPSAGGVGLRQGARPSSRAMYQALDSRVPGASWWSQPGRLRPGAVRFASGSGTSTTAATSELMNGNPDKVLTDGDAWNDEDLSAVRLDDSGKAVLRQDARLLDRVYPSATAGSTVAFTYEDRSRDGSKTLTLEPGAGARCRA